MKAAVSIIGIVAVALAVCWAANLVVFTYPNVVPNQPLLNPQRVREVDGTNMVLESGRVVGLWPLYSSGLASEEVWSEISNQVRRSGFEVDIDPDQGQRLKIYVRWPRKLRDSAPPFTVPMIRQTVGREYRKPLAFGAYLNTNSQPDHTTNQNEPLRSDANQTPGR